MGAAQSNSRDHNRDVARPPEKTCYYELLGLDLRAADDEIRRAYKRKALELHPDRNINDVENATKRFALVQTAYEILSDPQERAWYDAHRDAILRGDPDPDTSDPYEHYNLHVTTTEELYSLMGRFNNSIPFDDGAKGFFGVLANTFEQLATEEAAASDWGGQPPLRYPPFGSAKDSYDATAKPFYSAWSVFTTRKSFNWKDKYRLSDAPDRRIRRLMEKENKKSRDEAIRDFNDTVRSLVAFVKKRDPRYIPSVQSEAERQQVLRHSTAAQAARSRAANQEKFANYTTPAWVKSSEGAEDHQGEFSFSEEESEVEQIECVVCGKGFKSEKQFIAHERSKKHIKAVQQIRRQMRKENSDLDLQTSTVSPRPAIDSAAQSGMDADEVEMPLHHQLPPQEDATERFGADEIQSQIRDPDDISGPSPYNSSGDDYAPRTSVQTRLITRSTEGEQLAPSQDGSEILLPDLADLHITTEATPQRVGKAKAKREKKAARQAALAHSETPHLCAICKSAFPSRTKLFEHIDDLGHALLVPAVARARQSKKDPRK